MPAKQAILVLSKGGGAAAKCAGFHTEPCAGYRWGFNGSQGDGSVEAAHVVEGQSR